jgi:hypothetical protein
MFILYNEDNDLVIYNTDNTLAYIEHKLPVIFNRKISSLLVSEKESLYIGKSIISWLKQGCCSFSKSDQLFEPDTSYSVKIKRNIFCRRNVSYLKITHCVWQVGHSVLIYVEFSCFRLEGLLSLAVRN